MKEIKYKDRRVPRKKQVDLYRGMLMSRMIEEKMLIQLRKGKISKWFSGIGQEAVAVGATHAMEADEIILPLHRNLGVFTCRGLPLEKLFEQLQGKEGGFSQGRERSFHFGTLMYHIVGMISHLGPQLSVGSGIGLAHNLSNENKAVLAFTGEGGTSEGEFHEALNVASVWDLPVIFLIENNGYGLSTPVNEQYNTEDLKIRAKAYGIEGYKIDGNNVLEVYEAINRIAGEIRKKPRPVLVEALTFRMRGHEEASGTRYVPKELFEEWGKRDPVENFEHDLLEEEVLDKETIQKYRDENAAQIDKALKTAYSKPEITPDTAKEIKDVYREYTPVKKDNSSVADTHNFMIFPAEKDKSKKRLVDAVSEGLRQSMYRYENLILMGQDIAEYGGVFKVTQGFLEEFGAERVRNTPLCEEAILGIALGLSLKGYKSMVEMQFADFISMGFNQVVNNLAKIHYRWGENADIVVRMPTGAGVGAGPFHSQSTEAWFAHVPGLKIVYPAFPSDAKGLISSAFEDPNPVICFEHKYLYRTTGEEVYDRFYTIELGKGRRVSEGDEVSIITYGTGVHWALEVLDDHPEIGADLIDLRTLAPWDKDLVADSVKRTGKVLILHEDTLTGGIGGEIAAFISEHCFEYLDGPVTRVASLDTPVPFAPSLEKNFLAGSRLESKLLRLMGY